MDKVRQLLTMDTVRKFLTLLINILYTPIFCYFFMINNEKVVYQWIAKINTFLSEAYHIKYEKLHDFLMELSVASIVCFLVLKIIRFWLKSDIRDLKKQNKQLSEDKKNLEKDKSKLQKKYDLLVEDSNFLRENFENTLKGFLSTFARNVLNFGTIEFGEKIMKELHFLHMTR